MPATVGMKGAGYYDRHSTAQMASIEALDDWLDDAVAEIALPAGAHPITILDLGSSEGRNAIRVMRTIVERLRRRTRQPIRSIFSDLSTNNFNQLFNNLDRAQRTDVFATAVYPGAVGGSFYGALLPPGTVHLATSFNAIHWLDRLPEVPMADSVVYRRPIPPRPGHSVSPKVISAYERQAEHDLVRFLDSRAKELVPGGKLLLASPGDSDQACIGDGIGELLNNACLDLVASGQMVRDEYERVTMPCYFRTVAELVAPLERRDSPLRDFFAVERAEALEAPVPFVVDFKQRGDVAVFADAYTGFLRAVSEPVVQRALNQPARRTPTVDSLYECIRTRLLAEPERYMLRYIVVAALLTRRQA